MWHIDRVHSCPLCKKFGSLAIFTPDTPRLVFGEQLGCQNADAGISFPFVFAEILATESHQFTGCSFLEASDDCCARGVLSILEVSNMSEKLISRRGAFSLLGLGAAFCFAVPTTLLTTSDAEAQQTAPAPNAGTPGAPASSGMTRRQARRAGREQRRKARRNARQMRREAGRNARTRRRQARRGNSNQPTKQQ